MGPSEDGKQQADIRVYFCPLTLEDQLDDCCVRMFVYWKIVLFQVYSTQLISVCWELYEYAFSLQLSHSTFLFPFLPLCVCVFPEGKIRHEL